MPVTGSASSKLRTQFGLDSPVLTQLGIYLKGVLQFDLGFSYRNHEPVLDLIVERLPATFLLMSAAFLFPGHPGRVAGRGRRARYANKRRWIDSSVMTGALPLYATPLFWLVADGHPAVSVMLAGCGLRHWRPWQQRPAGPRAGHRLAPDPAHRDVGRFFMAVYAPDARLGCWK